MRSLDKEIFRLAIPNIISNVSVPLLSSVDTALMGQLSVKHLGAVGLGSMIFNLFYWNFGFLRMGTTGMTAQAFGAKNDGNISATLVRSMLVAIILATFFLAFQSSIFELTSKLLAVSDDQQGLVKQYFLIRVWDAPASLGLYALMGWFFGMQNARIPLFITVVVNVINIALSYYLIAFRGLGIEGVAWGTVTAQYVGLMMALVIMAYKYGRYFKKLAWKYILNYRGFMGFLTVNRDIFIRTLCLTFAFAFFYSQSSQYGPVILAINVVLLQFLNWMSYGIDGFAFAAESIVGKYKGAQNAEMLTKSIRRIFVWALGLGIGYSAFYGILGQTIFSLFTTDEAVIGLVDRYIFWMAIMPVIGFASYIWDGVFVGLTAAKAMRNSMLLSLIFYLVSYYLIGDLMGPDRLWLALLVFLFARGLIQTWQYRKRGILLA